jgi:polysaccharide pyruvyl transferase WcaK-like protein
MSDTSSMINMDGKGVYKVCLLGAKFDSGNMGVSALAASLVKLIKMNRSDASISLLIGNRSPSPHSLRISADTIIQIPVVNYRLSPKSAIQQHIFWIFLLACIQRVIPFRSVRKKIINSNLFLRTMKDADFVGDIRGGDSFSDIYGLSTLILGSMPVMVALLLRKELVLLPQTYGPYNSELGKYIARGILKRAHRIFSRDKEGVNFLKDLMKRHALKEVVFCPDVAFMLDSIKPKQTSIHPALPSVKKVPLFGFNISGLLYIDEYNKNNSLGLKIDYRSFVQKMALAVLDKTDAHLLFVPHTFSPAFASDPIACCEVIKTLPDSYKERVHIVSGEYDQSEIKAIIGSCDFFVGSRMHACIAALSQGIPTGGVAYSKKFVGVFESVGMAETVVDGRSIDTDEAVNLVLGLYVKREEMKATLKVKVISAQSKICSVFHETLSA